ncbi:hypothetical protein MBLNU457_4289t1 [Dothideomycetes sp. NU457]
MSARRSTQRRSGATEVARTQTSRGLPAYEPLLQPLNAAAQRKLSNLLNTHSSNALDDHLKKAIEILQDNVFGITESCANDESNISRQKARYEKQGVTDEAEAERLQKLTDGWKEMKTKVDQLSQKMDANIRKVIDDQANLNSIRDSMAEVSNDAMVEDMDATQPRSSRRRPENVDEDEEDTYADFTPTDPAGGPTQTQRATQRPATQPTKSFRDKLLRKRERYTSYTARQRYGSNNDYRTFRKGWHEAAYNDSAPPMPAESTWFAPTQVPQPGVTTQPAETASDSEDDIAVSRETISTRCPLTLAEFVDPVTSRKCPHSFERSAIESLINESVPNPHTQQTRRNARAEKIVQCPVPACASMLTLADLHDDVVLKRKIKRLQRAARDAEDEDEEHGREGVVVLGSDAPDGNEGWGEDVDGDGDAERQRKRARSVKQESSARMRRRERSVEM